MKHNLEVWSPEQIVSGWIVQTGVSLRTIETETGISRSKLSKLSKSGASLSVQNLQVIAKFLGFDPRSVFPKSQSLQAVDGAYLEIGNKIGEALIESLETRHSAGGNALTVNDVIAWHHATDGHLYKSDEIRSHLVAVAPVSSTSENLEIVDVGENSLASQKIAGGSGNLVRPKDVEQFLSSNIAPNEKHALLLGYIDANQSNGRRYFDRNLVHLAPGGQAMCTTYFTVLMNGKWVDDEPVIWNFSTEISSRPANASELAALLGSQDHQ